MDRTLKKNIVEIESVEKFAMANCVDILKKNESLGRHIVFKCKTCKKQFDSFQALGGHRTSHKNKENKLISMSTNGDSLPLEPKKHKCSICGAEFPNGQALGGHMRKHRDKLNKLEKTKTKSKENSKSSESAEVLHHKKDLDSTRRTLFIDLNLTPYENELMTGLIPL